MFGIHHTHSFLVKFSLALALSLSVSLSLSLSVGKMAARQWLTAFWSLSHMTQLMGILIGRLIRSCIACWQLGSSICKIDHICTHAFVGAATAGEVCAQIADPPMTQSPKAALSDNQPECDCSSSSSRAILNRQMHLGCRAGPAIALSHTVTHIMTCLCTRSATATVVLALAP